jgi:hypothetical protein
MLGSFINKYFQATLIQNVLQNCGEYQKKVNDTEFEKRVAYEVSVSKLEYLEEY